MSGSAGPPGRPQLGIDRKLREALDVVGREFLADILTRETDRHPDNLPALTDLAHVLTRLGRIEQGLAVDRRLVRLEPENPTAHYNLACSLALLGRVEEALDALERAADHGYDDLPHLLEDQDLAPLRDEPRFRALSRRLQRELA